MVFRVLGKTRKGSGHVQAAVRLLGDNDQGKRTVSPAAFRALATTGKDKIGRSVIHGVDQLSMPTFY